MHFSYPKMDSYLHSTTLRREEQQTITNPSTLQRTVTEKVRDYFNLGDAAPEFTLEGIVNAKRTNVTLKDYLGKWVVLFFYPSDFTFV